MNEKRLSPTAADRLALLGLLVAAVWGCADPVNYNTSTPPERERWEGIINPPHRGFPQEGGPPTPRLNKRFDLDADHSGRVRLYGGRRRSLRLPRHHLSGNMPAGRHRA